MSKNKYAIGYIGIGYLNKSLKAVSVNEVAGTAENALSGKFPIARPLYMFTDGEAKGPAGDFIAYFLSPAGQDIVKKEWFVPLKSTKGSQKSSKPRK